MGLETRRCERSVVGDATGLCLTTRRHYCRTVVGDFRPDRELFLLLLNPGCLDLLGFSGFAVSCFPLLASPPVLRGC